MAVVGGEDFSRLAFGKQFLVSSQTLAQNTLGGWCRHAIDERYTLHHHPELTVAFASATNTRMIGVGILLDPFNPNATNSDIIERLAIEAESFDAVEHLISTLSGRWVLYATVDGETRVYPDASGQKPVFYCWCDESLFIGSQPALLHHLGIIERRHDLAQQFSSGNNSGSWPVDVLPYTAVKQLKPNHYLRLDNGTAIRFWPGKCLEHKSRSQAAQQMCELLQGSISSAVNRHDCVLNLTGGYDSRAVLACAEPHWHRIEFFTMIRNWTPSHDISIPKAIAKRFGLSHSFVPVDQSADPELISRLRDNVGDMFLDRSLTSIHALHQFVGDRLYLPGLISEVNRCYYYEDGKPPADLSPENIAALAGFSENRIAVDGFARWLDECPTNLPVDILDLLYWEHRLGVWSACGLSFREAVNEQVPPMNCRRFLEIGLSTDVADRMAPHALIREIIACAKPQLLDYDFNWDWVDRWHRFRRDEMPIPWRVKRMLRWT